MTNDERRRTTVDRCADDECTFQTYALDIGNA